MGKPTQTDKSWVDKAIDLSKKAYGKVREWFVDKDQKPPPKSKANGGTRG